MTAVTIMAIVAIIGTIVSFVAHLITGSVSLLFVATVTAAISVACIYVKALKARKDMKLIVAIVGVMLMVASTTAFIVGYEELSELTAAKERVCSTYEPGQSVSTIVTYRNDKCYAYGVLDEPTSTKGVKALEWITSTDKPTERCDISHDAYFVKAVDAAILYHREAIASVIIAVVAFVALCLGLKFI